MQLNALIYQVFILKIILQLIFRFKSIDSQNFEDILKEVNILSKLSEVHVVRYYESWIESNSLYIQMELCSHNLKKVIEEKPKCFQRQSSEAMNSIEFYISCQLFKELLESVGYLHESNPPIIHRDLKPHNILITEESRNGRFLKLCDFGLATFDSFTTVSHLVGKGTPKYMAPETLIPSSSTRTRYNTKADIYSLGVIAQELFDIDIYS